jgi:glycine reductase complex component B subunit gamma
MSAVRVVHYLNQFFAGIGGEAQADAPPGRKPGPVGPGLAFQQALGDRGELVATVYCGDNYANEQPGAMDRILELITKDDPQLLIAGPAFGAGRYGLACGQVCVQAQEKLGIVALSGMHPENPGADLYRTKVLLARTRDNAAGMRQASETMVRLALKLCDGQELGSPDEDGYIPTGRRVHLQAKKNAAERAVDMLLSKVSGRPYDTEWAVPTYSMVDPAPPIADVAHAKIALITTGGVVPRGNPDRLESAYASKWLKYSIAGLDGLQADQWESIHGGFDTTNVNQDPDRMAPLDGLRALQREGAFGELHDEMFVTVGNTSAIPTMRRFAQQMSRDLQAAGVEGVILTGA